MTDSSTRVRQIFVAYPYSLGAPYRTALSEKFDGSGIELRYADDTLANSHVMEKIRRMMGEADVCFFDVTGSNPNVLFELGYALGAQEPGFVVVHEDAVTKLNADITGWDQLRYSDLPDLANKVFERVSQSRIPRREVTEQLPVVPDVREILRELRFGIPAGDSPRLCIYAIPSHYNRHYVAREALGEPPFRASDLPSSVFAGPNKTGYTTYFWLRGFDYSHHPGPDFVEVYSGQNDGAAQSTRATNFRIYLSGAAAYMQRLRTGHGNHPFLYMFMFEEILEMALISIADARRRLGFESQGALSVGCVLLHAADARISESQRDFYVADDKGRPIVEASDQIWIPERPITVDSDALESSAKPLAKEMTADLRVRLE